MDDAATAFLSTTGGKCGFGATEAEYNNFNLYVKELLTACCRWWSTVTSACGWRRSAMRRADGSTQLAAGSNLDAIALEERRDATFDDVDIVVAATGGDLKIVGSQVSAHNADLVAANDLVIRSSEDRYS